MILSFIELQNKSKKEKTKKKQKRDFKIIFKTTISTSNSKSLARLLNFYYNANKNTRTTAALI
jgi:hypothetical protein